MKRYFIPTVLLLLSFILTACVKLAVNPAATIDVGKINRPPATLKWKLRYDGPLTDFVILQDGFLYGCSQGSLLSIDRHTGKIRWEAPAGDWFVSTPIMYKNTIYFSGGVGSVIYAVDAKTGNEQWHTATQKLNIATGPTIENGVIYYGIADRDYDGDHPYLSGDGYLVAADAKTGRMLWKTKVPNGMVTNHPIIAKGTIYFGNTKGLLYALDIKKQQIKWVYDTHSNFPLFDLIMVNNTIYPISRNVCSVDAKTGQGKWTNEIDSRNTPQYEQKVFYVTTDYEFLAINAESGRQKWGLKGMGWLQDGLTLSSGIAYVGSENNKLYAIDLAKRKIKWVLQTKEGVGSALTADSSTAYFADREFINDKRFIYAVTEPSQK